MAPPGFDPRVGRDGGCVFRGRCPRLLYDPLRGSSMDSAGDFRGGKRQMKRLLVRGWRRHCLLSRRPLRSQDRPGLGRVDRDVARVAGAHT